MRPRMLARVTLYKNVFYSSLGVILRLVVCRDRTAGSDVSVTVEQGED
jgi:hypothetical protein